MNKKRPVFAYVLTILNALTAGYLSFNGILHWQTVYAKNSIYLLNQIIAQDLVTFFLGMPMLLITALMAINGSARGYLAWLGVLSYFISTFLGYACGIAFNQFYLFYVTVFSLSLFAMIGGVISLDIETFCLRFASRTPVKTIALFLGGSGLALAWQWLKVILPAVSKGGGEPLLLKMLGTTSLVNQVADLGIVFPLAIAGAVWIWKRNSWGYILAGVLLIDGFFKGFTFLTAQWVFYINSKKPVSELLAFWGALTVLMLILIFTILRNLREETIQSHHNRITAEV
ncbi:MAG: hypothetical protein ACM3X9_09685 [Bacillota bacterium]